MMSLVGGLWHKHQDRLKKKGEKYNKLNKNEKIAP